MARLTERIRNGVYIQTILQPDHSAYPCIVIEAPLTGRDYRDPRIDDTVWRVFNDRTKVTIKNNLTYDDALTVATESFFTAMKG